MCGVIGEQLHVRRGVRGKIPTIRERHRSRDVRDGDGVGKNVPGQGEEIERGPRWSGCGLTPNVRGANELAEGGGRGEVGPSDDSNTIGSCFRQRRIFIPFRSEHFGDSNFEDVGKGDLLATRYPICGKFYRFSQGTNLMIHEL